MLIDYSTRAAFDGPAAYWPDEAIVAIYDWHGVWGVNMQESELYWFYRSDLVPLSADPPSFSHRMF